MSSSPSPPPSNPDDDHTEAYALARYLLATIYVLVAACSAYMLLTSRQNQSASKYSWQRFFHSSVFFGLITRSLFMFLQPPVQQEIIDIPNCVNTFMSIVPSLLFFTGYIALLCFWAEMYYRSQPNHKSDGTESKRLFQLYIGVNVLMYLFFAIMLSIDLPNCYKNISPDDPNYPIFSSQLQLISSSVNAAIYLLLAIFFVFFGVRFYQTLAAIKESVVLSRITRLDVLWKLIGVAGILSCVFIVRFSIIVKNIVADVTSGLWWFDPLYYLLLEVVPILVIFFIFRASSQGSTPPAVGNMNISSDSKTINDENAPLLRQYNPYRAPLQSQQHA